MTEDTGLNNNNNLLYEANDNEGVNPMYTDKETVKTQNGYGKVKKKVNNLSLYLKTQNKTKQNKKKILSFLIGPLSFLCLVNNNVFDKAF